MEAEVLKTVDQIAGLGAWVWGYARAATGSAVPASSIGVPRAGT
jgi:hypothetical protein